MPTGKEQDYVLGIRNEDGIFEPIGKAINHPDISSPEMVETSELPDFHKGFEIGCSFEPPKTYRELKKFIKAVQPCLNYVIWWEKTYGCNNWRKMHGLPMMRRWKRRK